MNDSWKTTIRDALLNLPATVKMTEIARETGVTASQLYAFRNNRAMSADAIKRLERWLLDAGKLEEHPRGSVCAVPNVHLPMSKAPASAHEAAPSYVFRRFEERTAAPDDSPRRLPLGDGLFERPDGLRERQCPSCLSFTPERWDGEITLYCLICGGPLGLQCVCGVVHLDRKAKYCTVCRHPLEPIRAPNPPHAGLTYQSLAAASGAHGPTDLNAPPKRKPKEPR